MTSEALGSSRAIDPATRGGARAVERLAGDMIGWLTTVTPEGQPQSRPVWFLWENGEILVYSYRRAYRNRNIRTNPRVAFHLGDDGEGGDIVSIEGEARIDETAPPAKDHPVYMAKYGSWIADYGWTPEWFSAEYPVPIRIRPTRLTT